MHTHGQIQMFCAVLLFYFKRLLAKPTAARLKAFEECLSKVPFNVNVNVNVVQAATRKTHSRATEGFRRVFVESSIQCPL